MKITDRELLYPSWGRWLQAIVLSLLLGPIGLILLTLCVWFGFLWGVVCLLLLYPVGCILYTLTDQPQYWLKRITPVGKYKI